MSAPERVIVLAAGRSHQLDGAIKVLIRHPTTGRTILDDIAQAFAGKHVTVVVGFRSIEVMQTRPDLEFVVNPNWALTNNAMSLGLALDERPTYVVSGDIFLERSLVTRLDAAAPNLVLTRLSERRIPSSIHCVVRDGAVVDLYQGPIRDVSHPESTGLYKISDPELLWRWKRSCLEHGNLFAGQLLPVALAPVASVDIGDDLASEINTPTDYLNLMARTRGG